MIVGIGLDITDIQRIKEAQERRVTFAERVLTEQEKNIFDGLKGRRQIEFLAGRYAAKEAFSKAYGTGIGKIGFHDIEVLPNGAGQPIVTKSPYEGQAFISITHTDTVAAAQVILEQQTERKEN
ncbi:holo-ACP synthase [Pisciglobus halotolerans]|uniref:Holo-[acyl-carrier-protein] synthase n=1 Tax=Pisciglobus halotolerans TaxID=745365 RepID=A0A1I3E098_9LACT|nr:holo-ACP synthase [Pisciglobus halotolerans]SFH92279.1 holo-[acyl-carrier protein] synthase [Pisciglobus halotolerans]